MSSPKYGLERVPFNKKAKQLRTDDNLPGLTALAVGQVFPEVGKGHPGAELRQVLALAAVTAAQEWWQSGGNCWRAVGKAIRAAARNYRGTGGDAVDVTWRGAYDKDTRRYSSGGAVVVLGLDSDQPGAPILEAAPEEAPKQAQEDQGAISIERISHDAGADAERLAGTDFAAQGRRHDAGADGEAGYGVDGASAGLFSGRVHSTDWDIAQREAGERLCEHNPGAWKLLTAIYSAGTYSPKNETFKWDVDNYVNKDVGRKRRRDEVIKDAVAAAREHKRLTREVLAEIEAGTFPPPVEPPGERGPPPVRAALAVEPVPPVDVAAIERATLLATWERDWTAANVPMVRVPLPLYGAIRWQDIGRRQRERRIWLAEVRRFRGAPLVTWPAVSLLDGADV